MSNITSHEVLMNVTKLEEICTELMSFPFACISASNLSNVFLDNTPDVTEKKIRVQPMSGVYF